MIKKALFYINILWTGSFSYALIVPKISQQSPKIPSLQALSTKHLFLFNTKEEKEKLNYKLTTDATFRERLKFDGLFIENLDLSDLCLKDIDFSRCVFNSVDFNRSDLRGCNFDGCEFKSVDLKDAILYCSSDVAEENISIEGFKITDWNALVLINLYSSLIKESKINQENQEPNEALSKSRCLNKFFPGLKLNLAFYDLRNLDLTDINLENADLYCLQLQGTWLSNNVKVPDYPENDRSQLFTKWVDGEPEEQELYQKLANARFDLVSGVKPTQLIKGIEKKKKYLRNVNLNNAHLEGADLREANLENARLEKAYLERADLRKANLQNVNLVEARLKRADLRKANLQSAKLLMIRLEEADLREANLQNTNLLEARLQGAGLRKTNLHNADLYRAYIQGANLREAIISGTILNYFFGHFSSRLPPDCRDEDLIGIYQTCNVQETKNLLKDMLKAKGMLLGQIK